MNEQKVRYWWANQKTRWRPERGLGHVFAPLPDSSATFQEGWANVRKLRPGHVIVHDVGGKIRAVSSVMSEPRTARRPTLSDETDAEKDVAGYRGLGTLVDVEYVDLIPIGVTKIDAKWKISRFGPFSEAPTTAGRPLQVHLHFLSPTFIEMLRTTFARSGPDGF